MAHLRELAQDPDFDPAFDCIFQVIDSGSSTATPDELRAILEASPFGPGSRRATIIEEDYGEEYLTMNAPVASMLKAGARVVISEYGIQRELRDSPFEDGVMWLTRKIDGETWGVPEEAVPDRMTLLLMMTRWGAYPLWRENTIGSIEVGKLADIVILNGRIVDGSGNGGGRNVHR